MNMLQVQSIFFTGKKIVMIVQVKNTFSKLNFIFKQNIK